MPPALPPLISAKKLAVAKGARCDLCPLRENDIAVPSYANRGALRLVIVGEGPGRTEEKLGAPFVGMSGKVLDEALSKNGLKRSEAWVGNVALCRGDSDKENERAAECCAPRLLSELHQLPESIPILALGKAAAKALLGVRSILVARGFIWKAPAFEKAHVKSTSKMAQRLQIGDKRDSAILRAETIAGRAAIAGRVVLPTIHPAFVLRADTWNPVFQIDVARAARVVRGETPVPLEDVAKYSVGGLEVLRALGRVVSLDVETDGIDTRRAKMLCVGMASRGAIGVIWPWKAKYAKRLSAFLRSREGVVCHNGIFDIPVLRSHGVE